MSLRPSDRIGKLSACQISCLRGEGCGRLRVEMPLTQEYPREGQMSGDWE